MLKQYIQDKIDEAYDYMQNDTQKALKIFDEVLEIEKTNLDALNGKGSTLLKLHKFDEAEKIFNKSISIKKTPLALLNKGIMNKQQNDFNKALYYYDKVIELEPSLTDIVNQLKKDITQSKDYIDLIEYSDNVNKLIKQGIKLKNENKLIKSLDAFNKAIEINPRCKSQLNKIIYEIKFDIEKEFMYAPYEYDDTIQLDVVKKQFLRALRKENNLKKAMILINIILYSEENNLNALNYKGGILFIKGQNKEAIKYFDKCLEIERNYYYALYNKAIVLRTMNELYESLKCYNILMRDIIDTDKVKKQQKEILDKLKQ